LGAEPEDQPVVKPSRASIDDRASADEPGSWSENLPDALRAALEITVLALAAHLVADGHVPGPGYALGFGALVLAGCLAQARRRERLPMVVLAVLAAPLLLHALLPSPSMGVHAGMPGMAAVETAPLGLTPPMIWAHLVGALLTAIVLLGQDFVVELVLAWWARRPGAAVLPSPSQPPARRSRPVRRQRAELLAASPRRGPPSDRAATP